MAKTSSIHIRVEPNVKTEVDKILDNLGMTTTEAINRFLRQTILNSGIPFEIKTPQFNDEMLEAVAEAEEIAKNPGKYKSYNNLSEILEDIENDETIWNKVN